jgi:DNA mismatch endonuclease, patch repair protein
VTPEQRSKIMSAIRSKNTKPEVALRRAIWAKGYRYRIYYGRDKIDIAFPGKKIAIFVDGCFWHVCPIHFRPPKTNQTYWMPKLKKNKERDLATNKRLRKVGWTVLRFWEHEIVDMNQVIKTIAESVGVSAS